MKPFPFKLFAISALLVVIGCSSENPTPAKSTDPVETTTDDTSNQVDSLLEIPIIETPYCTVPRRSVTERKLSDLISDLRKSIKAKDTALLFSLMDSNIVSSHGFDALKSTWKNDPVGLWGKLDQLVSLHGSQQNDSTYRYPYFTDYKNCFGSTTDSNNPAFNEYNTYYSTKDTVLLYSENHINSKVKAKLVHTFLNSIEWVPTKNGFLNMTTFKGAISGYVLVSEVYRTGDYNLIIERDKFGSWKLTSFALND